MTEVSERLCVEAALLRQLVAIPSAWPQLRLPVREPLDGGMWFGLGEDEVRPYGEAVGAIVDALELLPEGERNEWARRFELAAGAASPAPEASGSQRRAADQHLQALVAELKRGTAMEDRGAVLDRLNGALVVYVRSGLLDAAGTEALGTAVEEALGQPIETFERARLGIDDPGDDESFVVTEADSSLGAPIRLCPARPQRHDGMLVTACILYEGGFELFWHLLHVTGAEVDSLDLGRFEASDDLGGTYSRVSEGSTWWSQRDGVSAAIGSMHSREAVTEGARELNVLRDGAQWVIPLADRG